MKKVFILCAILIIFFISTVAQKKSATQKIVAASEKANKKSQQISEASNQISNQANQIAANTQNVVVNAKAVIKVFEPILQYFKKKKKNTSNGGATVAYNSSSNNTTPSNTSAYPATSSSTYPTTPASAPQEQTTSSYPAAASTNSNSYPTSSANNTQNNAVEYEAPDDNHYNSDFTANLGSQQSAYGNFLDAFNGKIKDAYESETDSRNIDLVFITDQYGGYMLASPIYLKTDNTGLGGFKYENVVKEWSSANESEIALTKLTIAEFEKIKPEQVGQFYSIVKQTSGYATSFWSPVEEKLKGKVFAVRSEMGDRKAYALIAVVDQIGTYGPSGHLKIKIKCTGTDNNADGKADYNR